MKLGLSLTFAAVGSVVTLSATHALAWGPVGHQTVAYIAEDNLTPKASAAIAAILGRDTSLADVANYADQIRPMRPETAPWHFIDDGARSDEVSLDAFLGPVLVEDFTPL